MQTTIRPPPAFGPGLAELWRYRELFYFFTWRDIKVRYKQTFLGVAWAVLQPLLLMLVFTLLFGAGLRGQVDLPYPVFAFTGLLLWSLFAGGLMGAGMSMVANAHIIQKVYFPRLIVPISSLMVSLFDFCMGLPVLLALLAWFECSLPLSAPVFFFSGLLLAFAGTLGLGCGLSALSVKYRDFRYVLPFLVQLLLFVTPVIYPVSYVKAEWARRVLALNPMSGAIGLFRGTFSERPIDWTLTGISIASAAILLGLGLRYFRATEAYFADLA